MTNPPTQLEYDMGYTESEFANVLQGNFTGQSSDYRCQQTGPLEWSLKHIGNPFTATISIRQSRPRQLGIMSLPVLKVRFTLTSTDENQRNAFFDKFFKYFHKGGG